MKDKIRVGSTIQVHVNGDSIAAQVRRVGGSDPAYKGFVMLTLNIGAGVGYCVAREVEIADDVTSP